MRTVTVTELARNFRVMFDKVAFNHEVLAVIRNNHEVARIISGPATMTALEAMEDIYKTLSDEAASGRLNDSRPGEQELSDEVYNPRVS